jgi:hypothetical protein
MSTQTKKYQTQWASQFYVAAELTRRGYLVSLTFGNTSETDLLVYCPSRGQFTVDVKGQSTRNFWLLRRRELRQHYFTYTEFNWYIKIMDYFKKVSIDPCCR